MYDNILVPVVFDEGHDTEASVKVGLTLANEAAEFTVLHVMDAIPAYVSSQIPADVLARSHEDIDHHLSEWAGRLPGSMTALVSGHPGNTIVDYADNHDIDCIVLASHKPGLENFFLGSTADRVVRHAKCSVHVIR